jgi:uncharacterized protein YutE (UPF0331/DUF86 family)
MAEQLIEQKLESLQRCVQRVQERIPATSEALANDPDSQDIVDLNLTRAIQLCAQIASHWVSRHTELPPPESTREAFDLLAKAGVIHPDLATQLRHFVGFHSMMIHAHEEVDPGFVHAIGTGHLDTFRKFARHIAKAAGLNGPQNIKIEAEMSVDENGHRHLELPEPIRTQLEGRRVRIILEIPDDVIVDKENDAPK